MSYWLEDADGYLGDFATNVGINQLRKGPASFVAFLDNGGVTDQQELETIVSDLVAEGDPLTEYIVDMLDGAMVPVVITDGTEED